MRNRREGSKNMKISIIVPVYNAAPYLRECLDSLVGQTWKDIEVILINDGSTDESGAICESYLADPRVIYHHQRNAGVSIARNAGLDLATGEYICFVDADDWLEPDALERLQNESADIVIYNFYHGDKKHKEPLTDGVYPPEALYPKMISYVDEQGNIAYTFHSIWMRLFRRALLQAHQIRFEPRYHNGEDLLFTFQATMKAETIRVRCGDYLYHYRAVQTSQTNSYVKNFWALRKEIIAQLYDLIQVDTLKEQMPLRIFSWAVTGIENELRYAQGTRENIHAIVTDPVCDLFRGKLDAAQLSEKNQKYYRFICRHDARGLWEDYQRQIRAKKRRKTILRIKRAVRKLLPGHDKS